MFINCPHCHALVATNPATDEPPAHCPRCAEALRDPDPAAAPVRSATDSGSGDGARTDARASAPASSLPATGQDAPPQHADATADRAGPDLPATAGPEHVDASHPGAPEADEPAQAAHVAATPGRTDGQSVQPVSRPSRAGPGGLGIPALAALLRRRQVPPAGTIANTRAPDGVATADLTIDWPAHPAPGADAPGVTAPARDPATAPVAEPAAAGVAGPSPAPTASPSSAPSGNPSAAPVADHAADPLEQPAAEPVADLPAGPVADPPADPGGHALDVAAGLPAHAAATAQAPRASLAHGHAPAPSFVPQRVGTRRGPGHGPVLPILAVMLTLLLGVQWLLADRDRLAADPAWRPLVLQACALFRCTVPAWREPLALVLLDRDVRAHPAIPGALRVTATFRNDARWTQRWPRILLTLSDLEGREVGARAFEPSEYLRSAAPSAGIASNQSAVVRLDVVEPAPRVVAFAFEFR